MIKMQFTDVCLFSENVRKLADFYEKLFDIKVDGDDVHCFVNASGLGIAIYSKTAAENEMNFDLSGCGRGLSYIGFNCEDADTEYQRIRTLNICNPTEPKVWPWGAKSFHFKDIDGNLIVVRSWPKEK